MTSLDDLHFKRLGFKRDPQTAPLPLNHSRPAELGLSAMNHVNARLEKEPACVLLTQLPAAITDEDFCGSWLAIQCAMITEVNGALVLLGPPDRGPYRPVAVWPNVEGSGEHLTAAGEQSLQERSPLLIQREARGDSNAPSREWYEVAYPIQIEERLYGVVVLEVSPRPTAQLEAALQQLSWGAA